MFVNLNDQLVEVEKRLSGNKLWCFELWENPKTGGGMRDIINTRVVNFTSQVRSNMIASKLGSYPNARAVVTTCLDSIISFIQMLNFYYMSETNRVLTITTNFEVDLS